MYVLFSSKVVLQNRSTFVVVAIILEFSVLEMFDSPYIEYNSLIVSLTSRRPPLTSLQSLRAAYPLVFRKTRQRKTLSSFGKIY